MWKNCHDYNPMTCSIPLAPREHFNRKGSRHNQAGKVASPARLLISPTPGSAGHDGVEKQLPLNHTAG